MYIYHSTKCIEREEKKWDGNQKSFIYVLQMRAGYIKFYWSVTSYSTHTHTHTHGRKTYSHIKPAKPWFILVVSGSSRVAKIPDQYEGSMAVAEDKQ